MAMVNALFNTRDGHHPQKMRAKEKRAVLTHGPLNEPQHSGREGGGNCGPKK
jgi:hypothetical protein